MKTTILSAGLFVLATSVSVTFTSCSSNETAKQDAAKENTAQPAADLMKEAPAYDATKINATAPVIEITLKTLGNSMAEMKYDQTELHVKEGSTVKLKLVNTAKDASMQHNFVLIEKGSASKVGPEGMKAGPDNNYVPKMKELLVNTKLLLPGQSTEITFPAPPKGEYDFICTYPGHFTTMKGKFFVE
jgi:azurin